MLPHLGIIYIARKAWRTDAEARERASGRHELRDLDIVALKAALAGYATLAVVVLAIKVLTL